MTALEFAQQVLASGSAGCPCPNCTMAKVVIAAQPLLEAAITYARHKCIDDDANCDAGDHDDCGLRGKRAAIVEEANTYRMKMGLP